MLHPSSLTDQISIDRFIISIIFFSADWITHLKMLVNLRIISPTLGVKKKKTQNIWFAAIGNESL